MGPQKPRELVRVGGTMAASEKPLNSREFAAQVSDMVADAVMDKLEALGLTAENMKKLENLGEGVPLYGLGGPGGPEAASVSDAVLNKLTAFGLTEKNIKKLAILAGGMPLVVAGEGSSQATRAPLNLDDDTDGLDIPSSSFCESEDPFDSSTWDTKSNWQGSRELINEMQQPVILPASSLPEKPHPFFTSPQHCDTAPVQFSQRKRATRPGVITWEEAVLPRPKKKKRHNRVDFQKDEHDNGIQVGILLS